MVECKGLQGQTPHDRPYQQKLKILNTVDERGTCKENAQNFLHHLNTFVRIGAYTF